MGLAKLYGLKKEARGGPQARGCGLQRVFTPASQSGVHQPQGEVHGAVLTRRLPVGFLAVWAVVYVDVWGLLLFYANTAEMQETGVTGSQQFHERFPAELPDNSSSPLGRVQAVCAPTYRWGRVLWGQVRGQGEGKEGQGRPHQCMTRIGEGPGGPAGLPP